MDKPFSDVDWSLIQSFLAVAEAGSLSAASARLGLSQPTVGRHISALEAHWKVELFRRHARGLDLTALGQTLRAHATEMQTSMQAIARAAAGGETHVQGDVRIATSVFMGHFAMPKIIAQIRAQEPDIHIDLAPSDQSDNLLFREADIAVRMYRPTQLDMVTRHLGDIHLGMFASKSYLQRKGTPRSAEDLRTHDIVGYDTNDAIIRGMRALNIPATRDWFSVRCDNQATYWELVRAGCGLGFSQSKMAQNDPEIIELDIGLPLPTLPVWLTAHESIRHTPRISRVWSLLESGLRPFIS